MTNRKKETVNFDAVDRGDSVNIAEIVKQIADDLHSIRVSLAVIADTLAGEGA